MMTYPRRTAVIAIMAAVACVALNQNAFADDASSDEAATVIAFLALLGIVGFLYVIPSIVAFSRGHPNRWVILAINILFGETGIGWIGSLIWACSAVHRSPTGSNGGESGLNIFANDPQIVTIRSPIPSEADIGDIAHKLDRIRRLYDAGAITEAEHAAMRATILKAV